MLTPTSPTPTFPIGSHVRVIGQCALPVGAVTRVAQWDNVPADSVAVKHPDYLGTCVVVRRELLEATPRPYSEVREEALAKSADMLRCGSLCAVEFPAKDVEALRVLRDSVVRGGIPGVPEHELVNRLADMVWKLEGFREENGFAE